MYASHCSRVLRPPKSPESGRQKHEDVNMVRIIEISVSFRRELDFEGCKATKNHPGGHLESTRTPSLHSKGRLGGQLGARTGKLGARKAQLGAQKASKRRLEARLGRPMGAWRPGANLLRLSPSIAPEAPGPFIRIYICLLYTSPSPRDRG